MSPERLIELQKAYIKYIINFLDAEDPNAGLLRTFLDNWFGYYMGDNFLKRTGRVRWFNRGDLAKKPDALEKFHFHSVKARDIYKAEGELASEPLVKDHALPVVAMMEDLKKLQPRTEEVIEKYLIDSYKVALITSKEHKQLSVAGLGSKMPEGANGDVAKRYDKVGIKLVKLSA